MVILNHLRSLRPSWARDPWIKDSQIPDYMYTYEVINYAGVLGFFHIGGSLLYPVPTTQNFLFCGRKNTITTTHAEHGRVRKLPLP